MTRPDIIIDRHGWTVHADCDGRGCGNCFRGSAPTDALIEVAYRAPEKRDGGLSGSVTDYITWALIDSRRYEEGGSP